MATPQTTQVRTGNLVTTLSASGSAASVNSLDLTFGTTGKVLSVFDKRADKGVRIRAANATIGIRGTGCYLEIHEGRTYFCLCYGEAAIDGGGMPQTRIIKTTHHESPVWLDDRGGVMKVENADFVNHNDDELIMLERLAGREPPFVRLGLTGKY